MKIPTDQINDNAIPRDRTIIDPKSLEELERSILRTGLRTPIEVFATDDTFALISGLCHLTAVRRIHEKTGLDKFTSIEATLRTPGLQSRSDDPYG